jgi:hypothetical protein
MQAEDATLRGRLRALATPQRLALALAAGVGSGLLYFLVWRRPDWDVYPMVRMGLLVVAMLAAMAIGVILAMPRYFSPRKSAVGRAVALVFLGIVAFLPAVLPEAHALHPASLPTDRFWGRVATCLGLGTLAAVPVVALIWALKRDDGFEWWSTLALGLVAAVAANLALQLHCPIVDSMHILFGHSALAVIYAVAAWLVVRLSHRQSAS